MSLTSFIAMQRRLLAGVPEFLVGRVPSGWSSVAQEPHSNGRGVDDADSLVGEEGKISEELLVE